MTADENTRLCTWLPEIVKTLMPDSHQEDRGRDWHFTKTGGLAICRANGAWFRHSVGRGGFDPLALIAELRDDTADSKETLDWARAWLAAHEGTGTGGIDDDAEVESMAHAAASAERAKAMLAKRKPLADTLAVHYLQARSITTIPPTAALHFVANARVGEDALVAVLCTHGATVGVHVVYIDALGGKSLRRPAKQTFLADPTRGKGLVCVLQESADPSSAILLCEGIEDGLSAITAGRTETVLAVPGVRYLKHVEAKRGQRIVILRDGDAPDSAADKALTEGVDALLLAEATVSVTATPPNDDANAILCRDGAEALNALIDAAKPADLSATGGAQKLARLRARGKIVEFEQYRTKLAERLKIRRSTVDGLVAALRQPDHGDAELAKIIAALVKSEPDPWPQPVQLADVLTRLRERLEAHVIFPNRAQSVFITLWIALTYVLERLEYAPRLALDSPLPRCGKTTLQKILRLVVFRPVASDGLTPAALIRLKAVTGPVTVLLDEMGEDLARSPELDKVLRSGFERGSPYVRLRERPDGTMVHDVFEVFLLVAISLVGSVGGGLGDRAGHIHLQRKAKGAQVEKLRHGQNRRLLADIARQLARWAEDDGAELIESIHIPDELNDRQGDFSGMLLAIADQAGGDWPAEARKALVGVLGESADAADDDRVRLLHDIREILDKKLPEWVKDAAPQWYPRTPKRWVPEAQEIASEVLVGELLKLSDAPWSAPDSGRPLTQHKLARELRHFGIRPGIVGPDNSRIRGYRRLQFKESWEAYNSFSSYIPPVQSVQTVQSGGNPPKIDDFKVHSGVPAVHSENALKPAEISHSVHSVQSEPPPLGEKKDFGPQKPGLDATDHDHSGKNFSAPESNETASAAASPPKGNGGARRPSVRDFIRDLAAAKPTWSEARIAKVVGQPLAVVKRALAGWQRPDPGATRQ